MSSQVRSLEELQEEIRILKRVVAQNRVDTQQFLVAGFSSMNSRLEHLEEFMASISALARVTATSVQLLLEKTRNKIGAVLKLDREPIVLPTTPPKPPNDGVEVG
jgi:hypothetical protein